MSTDTTATAAHEVTGEPVTYEPDPRFVVVMPRLTFYVPDPDGYAGHTGIVVDKGAHPPAACADTCLNLLGSGQLVILER